METLLQQASQYITPQTLTVVAALAGLYVASKAVGKAWTITKGFLGKFSFGLVTSAILLLGGFAGAGYSVGDICSRPSTKPDPALAVGVNDDKLVELVKTNQADGVKNVLDYAKQRDAIRMGEIAKRDDGKIVIPTSVNPDPHPAVMTASASSNMPLSLSSGMLAASVALIITAFVTFVKSQA